MSDYIRRLLGDQEKILLITRQHAFVLISSIVLEVLLILGLGAGLGYLTAVIHPLFALGLILILVPLVTMVRDVLIWSNRQYIVTTRRVIQISGIFNKTVTDSSLEKVNDVKMVQSFWGRLFNYGDIQILTASEMGANLFRRIGDPIRFKTAMLNAKEEMAHDRDDVPVRRTAQTPRSVGREDIAGLIEQLDVLRQRGVLTEEEFQRKKAELLEKM
jgi:uncharacterized membrane protein YdbT with pleckstrin-like domain